MQCFAKIKNFWQEKPLQSIIILALVIRLVATVFSRGYGMHDDHFLVIEASQSWVEGIDYNNWLPWHQVNPVPSGHSFTYVGIHYLFFLAMKYLGIADPQLKMFIIRLIHALFSLIVVIFGYKITEKISGLKNARQVGLFLALLWFMPFLSVRNLVEITCIPFLVIGIWYIINAESKKHVLPAYFIAGLVSGISFSFRFQVLIFLGGTGLSLLIMKKWKEAFIYAAGVLISIAILQGITDIIIWKKPFMELKEYIIYNIAYKNAYGTNNYLMYISLLAGILIPPVSIFLFIGFFRSWKKYLLIFLPTLLFILFHTYFPNKQERFIFPVIPFFIILGIIGWNDFADKLKFRNNRQRFIKGSFIFFWIINLIILPFVTTAYSKKARVESMTYLSNYSHIKNLLLEESNNGKTFMLPDFYLKQWVTTYELGKIDKSKTDSCDNTSKFVKVIYSPEFYLNKSISQMPGFILFIGNENLEKRINNLQKIIGHLKAITIIKPGFVDRVMYDLNPANRNETVYIYETKFYH